VDYINVALGCRVKGACEHGNERSAFHKGQRVSLQAERLIDFQEKLCYLETLSQYHKLRSATFSPATMRRLTSTPLQG
jgi:hypothetical protein